MNATENLTREELIAYLREKKEDFFSDYGLVKLGLFGSFARNAGSKDSDIDLLIDFQPDTPDLYDKKLAIKSLVELHFDRKVDLCTEKYIKPYFKSQILRSVIYV